MRRSSPAPEQPRREWHKLELPLPRTSPLVLEGYSRAADKTFLHAPALHLALDAGLVAGRQPPYVFVTHSHPDHILDIAFLARRRLGVDIWCPQGLVEKLRAWIVATVELNARFNPDLVRYRIHGVRPGDSFELNADTHVEVFGCVHSTECVGYGFSLVKKRLAERFRGLAGPEIAAARLRGEEVSERVVEPMFVYLGDTNCEVYANEPGVLRFPVVVAECSFVPIKGKNASDCSEAKVEAKKDRHTHWDDLEPVVRSNPAVTFVLIHFSLRYSSSDVYGFFEEECREKSISNVVVFCPEYSP
eukprot:m51a1_g5666 hypothetical protein (303) ;mRNA; f:917104-918120